MKRVTALILCAVLAFGLLTACGNQNKQTLKVAMSPDFAPMEFVDASKTGQDQFAGFDVSLAKYLARELDMELQILPMSFDACQSAVETGQVDMAISGFSWMPDRAERFNLSDTYHAGDLTANQILVTTTANAGRYADAASLDGVRIGTQAASLQEWLVAEQLPGSVAVPFRDISEGVAQLRSGALDAIALAEGNADAIIASNPDLCKSGFSFELTEQLRDNLILLKKGNDELTVAVNDLLAKARDAGYYEQWYAEALEAAGIGVEIRYDDEGNVATEG